MSRFSPKRNGLCNNAEQEVLKFYILFFTHGVDFFKHSPRFQHRVGKRKIEYI